MNLEKIHKKIFATHQWVTLHQILSFCDSHTSHKEVTVLMRGILFQTFLKKYM